VRQVLDWSRHDCDVDEARTSAPKCRSMTRNSRERGGPIDGRKAAQNTEPEA
jgi:hypothetical protein